MVGGSGHGLQPPARGEQFKQRVFGMGGEENRSCRNFISISGKSTELPPFFVLMLTSCDGHLEPALPRKFFCSRCTSIDFLNICITTICPMVHEIFSKQTHEHTQAQAITSLPTFYRGVQIHINIFENVFLNVLHFFFFRK